MDNETWHVPTDVIDALLRKPGPTDETDELIASAGVEWPVKVVSWSEAL